MRLIKVNTACLALLALSSLTHCAAAEKAPVEESPRYAATMSQLPAAVAQSSSEKLWEEFQRSPYTHPQIPNVSYAGYRFSEKPLPSPAVVANVKDYGAKGDGKSDDWDAFHAAIEAAKTAGGGAILIPAGEYRLSKIVVLNASNLVLRGEGSGKTILQFTRPLAEVGPEKVGNWKASEGSPTCSWYGGLIWAEPGQPMLRPRDVEINIQPLAEAVPLAADAKQGDFELHVSETDAEKLQPLVGRVVPIAWTGGRELAMRIAGNSIMEQFDWSSYRELYDGSMTWIWANQIERIDGTKVTFKKPLRLDATVGNVHIGTTSPFISEIGIEGITIQFPLTEYAGHHREEGYNGLMLRSVVHGWVRDLEVVNADNGVILGGSSNCTVTDFKLSGRRNHHGTVMRFLSHDNLIQSFRIESQPIHGINTEGLSSGNVWRDGVMLYGTFDYHRMMSFDSVRTNITVNNTGGSGGNGTHGPGVGRRICHWNIRVTNGKPNSIAVPALFPNGALVGIQGTDLDLISTNLRRMPDGLDKGCIVADHGQVPAITDLFEAQLQLRLKTNNHQTASLREHTTHNGRE